MMWLKVLLNYWCTESISMDLTYHQMETFLLHSESLSFRNGALMNWCRVHCQHSPAYFMRQGNDGKDGWFSSWKFHLLAKMEAKGKLSYSREKVFTQSSTMLLYPVWYLALGGWICPFQRICLTIFLTLWKVWWLTSWISTLLCVGIQQELLVFFQNLSWHTCLLYKVMLKMIWPHYK